MGKAEASVETYLRKRVKEEGGRIRKVRWLCRRGAPDRLVWWPGPRCAFVECKSADGSLEASQIREFPKLIADGWKIFTVSSKDEVDKAVMEIKNG